ncbi:FHA domain-containing protein [Catenovulum sediminis]|uniref:FHA domain-containing protein n=1 Tax=Catenovulum sediminis TaxID=1740262 RepID=UPI00117FCD2C|nr:FHA domain-containing protein [Catenovulum sediminis]
MELIIQQLNSSGKVIAQHKISKQKITLGRAYSNDIIIDDPHICPHHAQLEIEDNGQICLVDCNSINGIFNQNKKPLAAVTNLNSGDSIYLAKLKFRILRVDHPVADTVALTQSEKTAEFISKKSVVLLLSVLILGLFILGEFLKSLTEFSAKSLYTPIISFIIVLLMWPLFWSLLSRFFKHEVRFWAHLSCLLISLLVFKLILFVGTIVSYNFGTQTALIFQATLSYLVTFICLKFSLYLFNQRKNKRQVKLSFIFTSAIFALLTIGVYVKKAEFSALPKYSGLILPPVLLWHQGIEKDDYIKSAQQVFQDAQQESVKETDKSTEHGDALEEALQDETVSSQ